MGELMTWPEAINNIGIAFAIAIALWAFFSH